MKAAIVDTNVFINAVIEDSEHHEEAKEIIENLDIIFVSSVILEEFIFCLKKMGLDDKFIVRRAKEIIENCVIIPVEDIDFEFALNIIENENLSCYRLNDLLIISAAKRRGLEIITFDKKLKKLYEKLKT